VQKMIGAISILISLMLRHPLIFEDGRGSF
jgi:hypothetical protein